jgi:HEAT repeat protein
VRARLTNHNSTIRSDAVGVAVTILEEAGDAESLGIIRTALADPSFDVRWMALEMIEKLSDRAQFASALEYMADHDPDTVAQPDGGQAYTHRDQARELLQKIKNQ